MRISTVTLGNKRNNPYLYLQGRYLLDAGFAPHTYIEATFRQGRVTLKVADKGTRRVSGKKRGASVVPVIDINAPELAQAFGAVEQLEVQCGGGTIIITPARREAKKRTRVRNDRVGTLCSGAGVGGEAAKRAGFIHAFAVELDPEYAELHEQNHPGGILFNQDIFDVRRELLPEVGTLFVTTPCPPWSVSRLLNSDGSRRDKSLPPEADPLACLIIPVLRLVDDLNPSLVVFENVPGWLGSATGWLVINSLTALGYTVEGRVLDPRNYGALTSRKRAVVIAAEGPVVWPEPTNTVRTLGEALEPLEAVEHEWFDFTKGEKTWLRDHWERHDGKGNGFAAQQVTEESTSVGTIKHGYYKPQGDSPVVRHPNRPHTYRHFTVTELKRLHGLPDDFHVGTAKMTAGEVIGQGLEVDVFTQILRTQGQALELVA